MSEIYRFGDFTLDPAGRRLLRRRERVPLTSKAFDTLAALVARAGETVEKEELLKLVWPDTFISDETLAQNISTVRRALGDEVEFPRFIATVPRRGYRFVMPVSRDAALPTPTSRPAAGVPQHGVGSVARARWLVSSVVLIAAAVGVLALKAFLQESVPTAPGPPVRFTVSAPAGTQLSTSGGGFAMAPDGSSVVFVANGPAGDDHLWLRPLAATTAHMLPDTDGASQPFWSADSRSIAFFSHDRLNVIQVDTGTVRSICPSPAPVSVAGSWSRQGDVIFGAIQSGLFHVSAAGGTAEPLNVSGCTKCALWPQFLPDGRHFLYTSYAPDPRNAGVYVASLDSSVSTKLLAAPSSSMFVEPGYLLDVEHGALLARRFDFRRLIAGEPREVAEGVAWNVATGRGAFSASQTGAIVFRPVVASRLTWFSRAGATLGTVGPLGQYDSFEISPDGRRVAAALLNPRVGTWDLWAFSDTAADATRLTFDPGSEVAPMWTADGQRVIYSGESNGTWRVLSVDATRSGVSRAIDAISHPPSFAVPLGRIPDGLLVFTPEQSFRGEHWIIRGDAASRHAWPAGLVHDVIARVSPDARWLAYGEPDVDSRGPHRALYVRALPPAEGRWQVSQEGDEPRWRRDSRELFYLTPDLSVRAVTIDDVRGVGPEQVLLRPAIVAPSGLIGQAYDVAPDGQAILAKIPVTEAGLVVTINWMPR